MLSRIVFICRVNCPVARLLIGYLGGSEETAAADWGMMLLSASGLLQAVTSDKA